ncbi:esterase/lipase family protein, partial [Chloroflexota bacterium]
FRGKMSRLTLSIAIGLCLQLTLSGSVQSASEDSIWEKELNFVFLHGAGGHACSLQLLDDSIMEQISGYIIDYEQANAGTKIRVDTLRRCYPNDVDINTWANNIADSINKHFPNKRNLILIGHSMGGKAALYAVARNINGLAEKVALVVTINSPIKSLLKYQVTGGGSISTYCEAQWLILNRGVCDSVVYYDSSQDGSWVGNNKHWLAFISAEVAPLSDQFNFAGVDALPRNMDDGIVPVSAQYSDGADVIYYGVYGHNDFSVLDGVAEFMAEQILHYIFGGSIECSVFTKGGTLEYKADWVLGTDYWEDVVGQVLTSSGRLEHKNESYFKWQEWEDIVGEYAPTGERGSYQVSRASFPVLTSIKESHWLNPDNRKDCRLYIRTRAAPRSSVQVDWIYQPRLLLALTRRDHYEVEIVTGTPLTRINRVSWLTDDSPDLRIRIWSEAESTFRWFKAKWRVYHKESRQRQVIDEIPAGISLGAG